MKVRDLIAKLQEMDGDLPVTTWAAGHHDRYAEIEPKHVVQLRDALFEFEREDQTVVTAPHVRIG